ncbi:PadR family transcriptional regulator [Alteromonas sp. D210916BOD_24]|uniref:PadR family transcriptional regulator n=1 Tax=Alteromonas sp. D210916BOD_24 TaxID=3157618 RepID=UPI00399CD64D
MTESRDQNAKWDAQLRKGTLELAVLAALEHQAKYGLELLNYFRTFDTMQLTEGTLYPLLDRLKREGALSASWQQEGEQRPRKYYALTDNGHQKLHQLRDRWQRSVTDLQQLLNIPPTMEGQANE